MNYYYYQIILRVKHIYTNRETWEVLTEHVSLGRQSGGDNLLCKQDSSSSIPSYYHIFFPNTILDEASNRLYVIITLRINYLITVRINENAVIIDNYLRL
jgi:hypothetical protein